ncbi:MAG: 23S rRNA (adenine(2503)-C(2))-methyltransferase RlmN [Holosporales bacterium]|nr:23S rRNA (adenine(2503)-C(2))-methyltransferase RlmN [Holosporales bacterium]
MKIPYNGVSHLTEIQMKQGILNYSKQELINLFSIKSIPKFRVDQILIWIYRFGKSSFYEMPNIGKNLQNDLDSWFYIHRPKIVNILKSVDGTLKFLLELFDNQTIETVLIPEENRNTICLSSQIGCPLGCRFCNTGHNGFIRNLSTEEILSQFLIAKEYLNNERLSNIVFMGMGEPLLNHNNVLKAIDNLMLDEQEGVSRRKITISTSGIADVLKTISKDLKCRLAISLHAPHDDIRSLIMPINNKFKIKDIMNACAEYSKYHKYLKITFEYLLLKNINDSAEHAHNLLELLKGFNCKINLLRFNAWNGCNFEESPIKNVKTFANILEKGGLVSPIRARRGEDIMGACGQLSSN